MTNNLIEIFGAVAGILYVILEIRQNIWLWPVGIVTSAVYIWIFLTGKLYADMSLQGYYLLISFLGWYWWLRGARPMKQSEAKENIKNWGNGENGRYFETEGQGNKETESLKVSNLKLRTGITLSIIFIFLFSTMWFVLVKLTDSPVPGWDSFITSLSIIATWMLARKIFEHWYLWIIVNTVAAILFFARELYPTVILYIVYCAMSFVGLAAWRKSFKSNK